MLCDSILLSSDVVKLYKCTVVVVVLRDLTLLCSEVVELYKGTVVVP